MGCIVRTFLLLVVLALGTTRALADGPPDAIIIRPGGSGPVTATPDDLYPEKEGFIVIRPHRAGSPKAGTLPRPRPIDEADIPVIRIIRGKPGQTASAQPGPSPAAPARPGALPMPPETLPAQPSPPTPSAAARSE